MDEIAKLVINEKENYSGAYDAGKIDGINQGISKGISQGITVGTNQMVINMLDDNVDINVISKYSKLPKRKILEIKRQQTKNKVK